MPYDKDELKGEIMKSVRTFYEICDISKSLLSSAEKRGKMSKIDIDSFITQYDLLRDIVNLSKLFNREYFDEKIQEVEESSKECLEKTREGLIKIICMI